MAEIKFKVTLEGVDEARAQLDELVALRRSAACAPDLAALQAIADLASSRARSICTPDSGGADRELVLHDLNEICRLARSLGAVDAHHG